MLVVTGEEMRILEKKTLDELGFSSLILMENAGSRIVEILKTKFGNLQNKKVHILVGSGNNGGDGLVVARHLLTIGAKPKIYLFGKRTNLTNENRINFEYIKKLKVDSVLVDYDQISRFRFSLGMADIIVDCILGTGFTGELSTKLASAIQVVNGIQSPVVAVDVPTGVDASTGQVLGEAIRADFTINLGAYKVGCFLYPGKDYAGKNIVVDLGLPLKSEKGPNRYLLHKDILRQLPKRSSWGHKGTFGHTLVVSGSRHYAGAASLCGFAALRSGAGVVTLAIPRGIYSRFSPSELILVPMAETEQGSFSNDSYTEFVQLMENKDVLVIGPGLSDEKDTQKLVRKILANWRKPAVIDAQALEALAPDFLQSITKEQREQWILTPHPGEMARMLKSNAEEINGARIDTAVNYSKKWGSIIVLKGAPTIITDGENTYINSTGNHGMGTAGTGDVLAGLIGGLLAQGAQPLQASTVGVYAHGLAGDLAGEQGQRTIIARDCLSKFSEILG